MMTGKPPWNANQHSNHLALIFKVCVTQQIKTANIQSSGLCKTVFKQSEDMPLQYTVGLSVQMEVSVAIPVIGNTS